MGWLYHFVDLTAEQKHERRELLDYYGAIAQLSILIPLLILQSYHVSAWLHRRWRSQAGFDVPSSPRAKREQSARTRFNITHLATALRRLQWWCGDPCTILGINLGTNGEAITTLAWSAWLLTLCFLQTGDDYLHLTKRFGTVASSQLPLHYLLALKSPFSPLQILTRCSHETLNSSHQLLGRLITGLLYLHAALYINFYVISSLLAAKVQEVYVLCGIFGIVAFTVVATTSLGPLRRWSYRVFYITHVVLATALLPVLFFHVSHIRMYLYETAAIYALNVVLRSVTSHKIPGTLRLIAGTNLLEVTIPLGKQYDALRKWEPGQHAYVSKSGRPLLRTFRSNPFTVASLPGTDGHLRFIARLLDGNTAKLAQAAAQAKTSCMLTVEGPYGLRTHAEALLRYDKVVFVAGGVGGTFTVPLYRQLLADLSPGRGSYRRQKVSFLWVVRSKDDMSWALPAEEKERQGFVERLKVCVTGGGVIASATSQDYVPSNGGAGEEGIELDEHKGLLDDDVGEAATEGVPTFAGRPDLVKLMDQVFAGDSSETVAIVVCGPRRLSQAVRQGVGPWVVRGRSVWLWDESFAY
ncbi:hypothetical protein LTR15_002895 [Elasticomyces elasticus]|nr:hypothetical protein LTR15_002895 [Elasticomyces elasticus]